MKAVGEKGQVDKSGWQPKTRRGWWAPELPPHFNAGLMSEINSALGPNCFKGRPSQRLGRRVDLMTVYAC